MKFRPLRAGLVHGQAQEMPTPPETMRAVTLEETGPPEALRLATIPTPSPVMSEVLVRVDAAGVNPIDAKTRSGAGLAKTIERTPIVPGFDFAGTVVKAPYEAYDFPPGTLVYGMSSFPRAGGSYAEYVVASTLSLARMPASLTPEHAAAVPLAALTAWGLVVEAARAHEGQHIVIHGASGGVGHFAVQLAAYFGARVTATASGRNVDWLRALGASAVIDYTRARFEEAVSGVDAVIDLVGNVRDDTGTRSLGTLRRGGLYVMVPTGAWPGYAEAAASAGVRSTSYKVVPDGHTLGAIARLIDSGALDVHVDQVYDLADAAHAHRQVETGHTRGKIVLRVRADA